MIKLFGRMFLATMTWVPLAANCARSQAESSVDSCAADVGCCDQADAANCPCACSRAVCCPTTKQVEEKKSCRTVKCEQVAVPAITLPWEQGGSPLTLFNCLRHFTSSHAEHPQCACTATVDCCDTCCSGIDCCCTPQRCGTVRVVRVLGREKYDATKCETSWEIQCVAPCCGCGGDSCSE
jgi:hypothetical protein